MLKDNQLQIIDNLINDLDGHQRSWLLGYIQGSTQAVAVNLDNLERPNLSPVAERKVNILYATETGNSKSLTMELHKILHTKGQKVKSASVNRLKLESLDKDARTIFVVATHGEGDPPEAAKKFFDSIADAKDQVLAGFSYAILGLGDSSYEKYCSAAVTLDQQLQKLGAKPFTEMQLLDVDYQKTKDKWIERIESAIEELDSNAIGQVIPIRKTDEALPAKRSTMGYNRLEPIVGKIKDIFVLNDIDSNKQTFHIEIKDFGDYAYRPGDSVGIIIPNTKGPDAVPRLYSISSSPSLHEGEIHLTVVLACHDNTDGTKGFGLASSYLSKMGIEDELRFYIHENKLFELPSETQDAIMIGPGTGVAPFRSLTFERQEKGDMGRNWLFFGDQFSHCDFLYQSEWQEHVELGSINQIDLAFSRDQENKIYVQDKIKSKASELWKWIQGGAMIYICGSKDPMSIDVERALREVISECAGITLDAAEDYLLQLEDDGRYIKEVY